MSELEFAKKLFAQPCDFMLAAAAPEQFPETPLSEVAFIGRSNVGKSSLLNALTNRKNLARASNTPGRTQQLVFFNLAKRLILVDLPGYGHASAPKDLKREWGLLTNYYLRKRPALRLVCLLLDSRHPPHANDIDMMNYLDKMAVSYQVILTKADQINAKEWDQKIQHVKALLQRHPAARPDVIMTTAEKAKGIDDVRQVLADFANQPDVL